MGELLLQFGADINGTDKNGETALCRAVVRNHSHLVTLLLKRGACRFIKGFRGDAIDVAKVFAKKRSNETILALLETYTEVEAEEEEKTLRELMLRLVIDEQDNRGETPLMAAVRKNDVNAVEVLLNSDAKLEISNNKGKSALDIAQTKKNVRPEIVKMLQDQKKKNLSSHIQIKDLQYQWHLKK